MLPLLPLLLPLLLLPLLLPLLLLRRRGRVSAAAPSYSLKLRPQSYFPTACIASHGITTAHRYPALPCPALPRGAEHCQKCYVKSTKFGCRFIT